MDKLSRDVFWLGTLGIGVEIGIVFLIFYRHRLAPVAAVLGGIALAAGYIGVHFLPHRAWFSDSFISQRGISPFSWFAASFEVVAALVLFATGLAAMSADGDSRGLATPAGAPSPLRTLRHPIVLLLTLSQVAALALSFVQVYA